MKLIDADKYFEIIRDDFEISGKSFRRVVDHLHEMEIVDAVEVVHGKWIKDCESIYCSACGFETSSLLPYVCDGEKWVPCYANRHCGNCGAKMDGGN